ncbi:hypothetical protein [Microbacterium sp. RU33B]|uniref:hypothetical protein n=1 Tax=Microbacterium sp. RU33B TaxID=1907390 RepID=UPI000961F2B8|nr:hypothetical protein [Microbacterium sp. RU33B]SIT74376.1 hypothetical protein SAMN05880545_1339 [Microbacterium sp. RU33B]
MTDSQQGAGLSRGKRALLFIIVGGLAAAALVSAGFVVFGEQGDIVARALWTVLILTAFALIVLAETRVQYRESWVLPLRVGGWVASAFIALFNSWDYRTDIGDTIFLVPLTIVSIVVIQLAVLHITLMGRAFWRDPSPAIAMSAVVATVCAAAVAVMIVIPLLVRPDDLFGDTYWRIVVALAIIGTVATVISPLVRAIVRPRRPEASATGHAGESTAPAAYPGQGAPHTAQQMPSSPPAQAPASYPPQPGYAPTGYAPQAPAWPTYYGTPVPLPILPDGTPDWQAYHTGQPTPGSRAYPQG